MTLLSISASFGALVWIFQEGNLAEVLHFNALGYTIAGNPIIMFSVIFGLSMDYEVLLLSRIQEAYRRTGDNTASVAEGLVKTAGVITGAALVMVTRVRGVRAGRHDHDQEHRRRHGHRGPPRRDDHPGPPRPRDDAAHGPLELVGARGARPVRRAARVQPRRGRRGRTGWRGEGRGGRLTRMTTMRDGDDGGVHVVSWGWGGQNQRAGIPWIGIFLVVFGGLLLLQQVAPEYQAAGSLVALAIGVAFLVSWLANHSTSALYLGAIITALTAARRPGRRQGHRRRRGLGHVVPRRRVPAHRRDPGRRSAAAGAGRSSSAGSARAQAARRSPGTSRVPGIGQYAWPIALIALGDPARAPRRDAHPLVLTPRSLASASGGLDAGQRPWSTASATPSASRTSSVVRDHERRAEQDRVAVRRRRVAGPRVDEDARARARPGRRLGQARRPRARPPASPGRRPARARPSARGRGSRRRSGARQALREEFARAARPCRACRHEVLRLEDPQHLAARRRPRPASGCT